MMYSNQGTLPQSSLPFRIKLSSGMTRTDPSTFTEAELNDAGWYIVGDRPTGAANQIVYWDRQNLQWGIRDKTQEELDEEAAALVAQIKEEITLSTQKRLDDFAKTKNYDGILSACTYATSAITTFATEGQYCITQRDATWATLYQIMAEVEAGTRAMPTGFADIEPDLPELVWPT